MAWKLPTKLFDMFGLAWVSLPSMECLMSFSLHGASIRKVAKSLWQGAIFDGSWTLWLEQSRGIFDIALLQAKICRRGWHFCHPLWKSHRKFSHIGISVLHETWRTIISWSLMVCLSLTCAFKFSIKRL